jgi:hypothetical protein
VGIVPKIPTVTVKSLPAFHPDLTCQILSAEQLKTPQRGFEGIRVRAKAFNCAIHALSADDLKNSKDQADHSEMLWTRPEVGVTSKLGAFISELGDDTDVWIGKWIKVTKWAVKDREIETTTAPMTGKGKR